MSADLGTLADAVLNAHGPGEQADAGTELAVAVQAVVAELAQLVAHWQTVADGDSADDEHEAALLIVSAVESDVLPC